MEQTSDQQPYKTSSTFAVAPLVWGMKTVFVNLYFVANPDGSWVLVDTGVPGCASKIRKAATELFGPDNPPRAIILTHGHFDHVGAVKELAREWDVPVYAHKLELPYLTGQSSYPPPDASVGGGAMAYLSFMYPKKPINIEGHVELLPDDKSVPALPGWRWLHTPGHTPGHISLFRDEDKTLIAGDAFVTRKPESATAVMTEKREVHGPPSYFTPDWAAAHHSVEALYRLEPEVAATGHGKPMRGEEMRQSLQQLVQDFWLVAVPKHGRYVHEPAVTDDQGVVSVPPPAGNPVPKALVVAGAVAVAGLAWAAWKSRNGGTARKHGGYRKNLKERPYSHNRALHNEPPAAIDPETDDPHALTNNYP